MVGKNDQIGLIEIGVECGFGDSACRVGTFSKSGGVAPIDDANDLDNR